MENCECSVLQGFMGAQSEAQRGINHVYSYLVNRQNFGHGKKTKNKKTKKNSRKNQNGGNLPWWLLPEDLLEEK